jgi:hypothetical protein
MKNQMMIMEKEENNKMIIMEKEEKNKLQNKEMIKNKNQIKQIKN